MQQNQNQTKYQQQQLTTNLRRKSCLKIYKKHKNCLEKRREQDLELASYLLCESEWEGERMRKLETQKGSNMDPGEKKGVQKTRVLEERLDEIQVQILHKFKKQPQH
jgi:hypothetical protein